MAAVFALNVSAQTDGKTLDVMFVHDTHSHLNPFATVEDGETQVMGGFARIKTLINEQKEENPDTLLLDAGDFSMGTLIQVVYEEEASELRMLGELGVDATTLGNHEYDYKAKGLANMLTNAAESGETVPALVISNLDWAAMEAAGLTEDQKLLREAFETYGVTEYQVIEKGGVRIAVTGIFGIDCEACVPNCPLIFRDRVEAMKEVVARIQANEDVDMIACVSHGGTWADEEKSEDEILAKGVPELDLIISGHTHSRLEEPIVHGDTYIVSVGEYGKYLGDLTMTQQENGRWSMESYDLIKVDESIEPDPETQEKADALMAMVDSKYLEQFGYTREQILCTNEVQFAPQSDTSEKHTELNLGSIMADAYTYAVEKVSMEALASSEMKLVDESENGTVRPIDPHPVDVAVVPSGTIRDSYPTGTITPENVFHSFSLGIGEDGIPGYPMISIYLTGAELKTAAEIDASISDLMTTARLYTDGLYWNYNPNRMILNKVTDVYLCDANENRVELEDDKLYRVVTDFYTSQMLSGVTDLSFGLLSIVPKFADGTPVERFEDAVVMAGDQELKVWAAIAMYMESFEDTDGDGIGNVPAKYSAPEGRKVVEDSKNIGELLKNPNKYFFMIVGVVLAVILLLVLIVVVIVKVTRKCLRKAGKRNKQAAAEDVQKKR